ncbi:MAG TPA: polyprenol monophosphomannose synthase [Vicinamibacterales bacterium]|jgi:dolichol-phosphate mannosyltransferase
MNPSMADLTIVVPTYNERERLDPLLMGIFQAADAQLINVQVVVVDDNSVDGTGQRADEWARGGRVRVVHRPKKLGLGSAVLDGFAVADSNIVGVMDADLSHPPDLIPILYSTMRAGDLDFVVASRYVPDGGTRDWAFARRALSRVACWLARPITPVRDATSGFFLARRDRLDGFRTRVRGFKIGLELFVRAEPRRVAEVGYVFVGRTSGQSKLTLRECTGFILQLAGLYVRSLSGAAARPGHFIVPVRAESRTTASVARRLGA